MSKFEIDITTWVGSQIFAEHYYGKILIPMDRREPEPGAYICDVELEHNAPEYAPKSWEPGEPYISSRFANPHAVIEAAREWFQNDKRFVKPGDKLVIWRTWKRWIEDPNGRENKSSLASSSAGACHANG